MQKYRWQIILGLSLILLSACFYLLHFFIFQDSHHIFIFLLSDIAFIPIEVLIVTLIIHQFLNAREKQHIMEKLNMLIGVFYSEMGTSLVAHFSDLDPQLEKIQAKLTDENNWNKKDYNQLKKKIESHDYSVEANKANFQALKVFLHEKRPFLLNLIENPNLLEHETFTDLLLAVFHLAEELEHRKDINTLPEDDCQHLCGDIQRAYRLLVYEWVVYMQYTKNEYPYLFSLALRMNPFDRSSSVIVTE